MAQQNKPHRRTARDAGLSNKSTRYTVPGERKKKPIVPIIALAAVVLAGVGAFALVGNGDLQLPGNTDGQASQQSQPQGDASDTGDSEMRGQDADSAETEETSQVADADSGHSADSGHDAESYKKSQEDAKKTDSPDFSDGAASGSSDASVGSSSGTASAGSGGLAVSGSSGTASSGSGSSSSSSSGSGSSKSSVKGYSKLKACYNDLDKQSDKLVEFVNATYNANLYKSLSVRKADYKKFKKLYNKILKVIEGSDGNWAVSSVKTGKSLNAAKKELERAAKLLKKRLDIIDAGYKAINGLGKKATKSQIKKANNKACKDSAPTYNKFVKAMNAAESDMS